MEDFILDGHERHNLSAVEVLFCLLVTIHWDKENKFPENDWLSNKIGVSTRQIGAIKDTLKIREVLDSEGKVTIDIPLKTPQYTPLPVVEEKESDNLWDEKEPSPKPVPGDFSKNILAINGKVKDPGVWSGADLTRYFRLKLNHTFGISIPEFVRGKESGQATTLIRHLGNGRLAREIIDYLFDNWKLLCSKYNFKGAPSMGLILSFRDSLQAEMHGLSATSSRNERYDEQSHAMDTQESGW